MSNGRVAQYDFVMATKPSTWTPMDIAISDEVDKLMNIAGISNRELERRTQGAIAYSRVRNIRAKEKAPMRVGELYVLCEAIGVDPQQVLKNAHEKSLTLENAATELSNEDRAKLALERAQRAAEYGLAAMEGGKRHEEDDGIA